MISITCTQCQTVLTIDDAFAGGVCRCQHCGTIQTVPSKLKGTGTAQPYVNPSAAKAKSLYQNEAAPRTTGGNVATSGATSPSGLDDLAQAVASSSGLSGSGLQQAQLRAAITPPAARSTPNTQQVQPIAYSAPTLEPRQKKFPIVPIAIGGGVVLVGLIGVIIFLLMSHNSSTPGTSPNGGPGSTGGAEFCGEPIDGASVIYLLDDANSISSDFDPLKAATYQSIASLGSDHKFAVVLWNNGEDFSFPRDGLAPANTAQLESLRGKLQDTQATGASHLRSALDRAMARSPAAIVLVTAKSKLDEDDESAIASAKDSAGSRIKFYNFTVGSNGDNAVLKMSANGKYRHFSSQELRAATP